MGAKSSRLDNMARSHYVIGLTGTGKTTIIDRLDKERSPENPKKERAFPTEFFNNAEEDHFYIIGRDSRRVMYGYVARKALIGIIVVIDSTDVEKLDEAVAQLKQFLAVTYECEGTVIMILANKQDVDGAMSVEHIESKVKEGIKEREYENSLFVMPCCATEGNGLLVAYDYFLKQSKLKKDEKLELGLIPEAWKNIDWKAAELAIDEEKRNSLALAHKMKKSAFKNPIKAFKTMLTC